MVATLTGPDASRHQGAVNWAQVKAAGHEFAICKLTDGLTYRYVSWGATNLPKVRAAGLIPGAYHWLDAGPTGQLNDPRGQARYFVDALRASIGFDGVLTVVDVEVERAAGVVISKPGIDSVNLFADEFRNLTGGHPLGIYTGRWYWRDMIGNPRGNHLGYLWHSEYEPTPAEIADGPELDNYGDWPHATLWQYTSSGTCPGISGACDLNVFYGTRADLLALTGAIPIPPEEEEPMSLMMVQSKESGAVLLVTGGASILIVSNAEKDAHLAAGIPLLAVGGNQFRRYEAIRGDVAPVDQVDEAAIAGAVSAAVIEAIAGLPGGTAVTTEQLEAAAEVGVKRAFADAAAPDTPDA